MVNKYAAIVYIRLNASMVNKTTKTCLKYSSRSEIFYSWQNESKN